MAAPSCAWHFRTQPRLGTSNLRAPCQTSFKILVSNESWTRWVKLQLILPSPDTTYLFSSENLWSVNKPVRIWNEEALFDAWRCKNGVKWTNDLPYLPFLRTTIKQNYHHYFDQQQCDFGWKPYRSIWKLYSNNLNCPSWADSTIFKVSAWSGFTKEIRCWRFLLISSLEKCHFKNFRHFWKLLTLEIIFFSAGKLR